eukprot:TRINITY_DN7003_c0_g1_i1.p1 TRINITY_DN7003_c0_g1~~TRINITY_DN7003_c0_g1_i1.p1  ORF type:complete len:142 (-),score=22.84 TRINITY_DN7003_c0_g1_i1:26-451(-)
MSSSAVLISLLVASVLFFGDSEGSYIVGRNCDQELVGRWVGIVPTLNTLVINADATLDGTLLGLVIHGFVTTDVTVQPLWVDLHLDINTVVPCIYSITNDLNGGKILTLALDLNLVSILSGSCVRPKTFTSSNTLVLTAVL